MPTVSIIIPVYNCEAYLRETVDSVLAQDFKDFELIVVDDGSTDSSRDIVRSYSDPRIRLIELSNSRVCVARNTGLRESRGEFVAMLDHDDFWFPNKLSSQIALMRDDPGIGLAFTIDTRWVRDDSGQFPQPGQFAHLSHPGGIDPTYTGWVYHKLLLECFVLTSDALIRREVYDRVGAFDESLPYSEDWDLFLRISREYRFARLNQVGTLYRQHPTQGSKLPRDIDYASRLIEGAIARYGKTGPDGTRVDEHALRQTLARLSYWHGMVHLRAGSLEHSRRALGHALRLEPFSPRYALAWMKSLAGLRDKVSHPSPTT